MPESSNTSGESVRSVKPEDSGEKIQRSSSTSESKRGIIATFFQAISLASTNEPNDELNAPDLREYIEELKLRIWGKFLTVVLYSIGPLSVIVLVEALNFFVPLPAITIETASGSYPIITSQLINATAAALLIVRATRILFTDWTEIMRRFNQ